MSLINDDLFVVQRGNSIYKVASSTLKNEYASEAQVFVSPNPPNNPVEGTLWWSTREGNLFIWYDDGDSQQWVDASPAFVEIDYERIEDYIDQVVLDSAVSSIIPGDNVTVSPVTGKGNVTVSVDLSELDNKVDITDFETDQQEQDDKIAELERIIKDLADRLDQLEDKVAGISSIDGGYPNAEGVFDEPDTDGGANNAAGEFTDPDITGGDAEGYD